MNFIIFILQESIDLRLIHLIFNHTFTANEGKEEEEEST